MEKLAGLLAEASRPLLILGGSGWTEEARDATIRFATGNYDYGLKLLMSCCTLDRANLIYRQALRRTEKAKYKNNLRGSRLSWLNEMPRICRVPPRSVTTFSKVAPSHRTITPWSDPEAR